MKLFIRCLKNFIFILLCLLVLASVTRIATPEDVHWNIAKRTIYGIDDLPRNSVDVVAVGGSSCCHSFTPLELWEGQKLSGYTLSTTAQPIRAGYYLLKSFLATQNPQVVCVEVIGSHTDEEPNIRRVYDTMPMSFAKFEAINNYANLPNLVSLFQGNNPGLENNGTESWVSYMFPISKYHSNWKDLRMGSFIRDEVSDLNNMVFRGFSASNGQINQQFDGITNLNVESAKFEKYWEQWLLKYVELCKKENITLVLYAALTTSQWNAEKHNAMQEFADANGVRFVDFNMQETIKEAEIDFATDNMDSNHSNTFGAIKQTRHLGKVIAEFAEIPENRPAAETEALDYEYFLYNNWVETSRLRMETNMEQYLSRILSEENGNDYTVFFSIRDEGVNALNDELRSKLAEFGFESSFGPEKANHSFLGVWTNGTVDYEQMSELNYRSEDLLEYNGSLKNGLKYVVQSAGFQCGDVSSIIINDVEKSKNMRGFNIVVYDNIRQLVVDSVNWDTCGNPGLQINR